MRKPDVDLAALRDLVARVYGRRPVEITRTATGTSTQVYRIQAEEVIHYLRVAEDQPDRYGVEVLVHERLLGLGARVPAIVHYEPFDPALDRSILITTEIPGHPVSGMSETSTTPDVLRSAGRDLALINSLPVAGFGFMERSDPFPASLSADFADARAFIEQDLEFDLATVQPDLTPSVVNEIKVAVQSWSDYLSGHTGRLAHGDLDGSHIYVDEAGYSGIIDFGEIRGADPLYDMGHFAVVAGESLPENALDSLLAGYSEVTPLSEENLRRMWLWAALIGVRFLARTRDRTTPAQRARTAGRVALALQRSYR